MAWSGWLTFDGNEIINVARVEAYARNQPWFKPLYNNDYLSPMLGEKYRTPLVDDAPWTDPDIEESYEFLGVYPLSVDGLESSTGSAVVTESTEDGGVAGRIRHATKQIVFSCVLLAETEAGAEYGSKWLRRALMTGPCGPSGCFGGTLCYLASEPFVDIHPQGDVAAVLSGGTAGASNTDVVLAGGNAKTQADRTYSGGSASTTVEVLTSSIDVFKVERDLDRRYAECLNDITRTLRKVTFTSLPRLTGKSHLRSGGEAWTVTFTATAGSPFELGPEIPVVEGFLDPSVEVPWAGGVEPAGGAIDLNGYMVSDESGCSPPLLHPLYDPAHPAINLPPSAPSIPLGHFVPPQNWQRRQFTIPKQYVPLWGEMVPKVSVHARYENARNMRLRFYADPLGLGDTSDDPCSFCGDIVVSYIPQGYSLIIDGAEETVTAVAPGGIEQRADSLVFASDGTPFTWPRLSCGTGYVVTIDLPATQIPPVVDLSLFERVV